MSNTKQSSELIRGTHLLEDDPSVKLAACHDLVDKVLEVLQVQQLVYILINEYNIFFILF